MGKGEPREVNIEWDAWFSMNGLNSLSMLWCDNFGEKNTWQTRLENATKYFKKKYGEPETVIVPVGVKVKGKGIKIIETEFCPNNNLIVCMKRIDDEKQAVR